MNGLMMEIEIGGNKMCETIYVSEELIKELDIIMEELQSKNIKVGGCVTTDIPHPVKTYNDVIEYLIEQYILSIEFSK